METIQIFITGETVTEILINLIICTITKDILLFLKL